MIAADILNKAKKYCSYQERSQQELRDKLYSLGLHKSEVEEAIALLITEGFLNEERFAIAYAGGKFRIKRWGKIKIKQGLKLKKVSDYCIHKALQAIPDNDYNQTLTELTDKYRKKIKESNPIKKNQLLARQLISCGYEPELVWQYIQKEG